MATAASLPPARGAQQQQQRRRAQLPRATGSRYTAVHRALAGSHEEEGDGDDTDDEGDGVGCGAHGRARRSCGQMVRARPVAAALVLALCLSTVVFWRDPAAAATPASHAPALAALAAAASRLPLHRDTTEQLAAVGASGDADDGIVVGDLTACVPGFDAPDGSCALRRGEVLVATYFTQSEGGESWIVAAAVRFAARLGISMPASGRFASSSSSSCDVLTLVRRNRAAYAAAHGYSWAVRTVNLDPSRPPPWGKVLAALRWLRSFKVVFLLDADAFITHLATPLTTPATHACTCADTPLLCAAGRNIDVQCLDVPPPAAPARVPRMVVRMSDAFGEWLLSAAAAAANRAAVNATADATDVTAPAATGVVSPAWLRDAAGDVIMTADPLGVNSGVMVLKASQWTAGWLQRVYAQVQFIRSGHWEQAAMAHILGMSVDDRRHVALASQRVMNSYVGNDPPPAGAWHQHDFVVHFAGVRGGLGHHVAALQDMVRADATDAADVAHLDCKPAGAATTWRSWWTSPFALSAAPAFLPAPATPSTSPSLQ